MAQTKSKSCNKFDSFRIANIKNRIFGRSYEIKYFSLKTQILFEFLRLGMVVFENFIKETKFPVATTKLEGL